MYLFIPCSSNRKTGPIPVTYTNEKSCPPSCALYKKCYAATGPTKIHWNRAKNGLSIDNLCNKIKSLPFGQLWRHNIAGDLPGNGDKINKNDLVKLVKSNKGRKGFTYTHKPLNEKNLLLIKWANFNGFTINASADNLKQADKFVKLGLPTVTILPEKQLTSCVTPDNNKVVVCPAVTHDYVFCMNCGLCQKKDRKVIIGFPAHGILKKYAENLTKI